MTQYLTGYEEVRCIVVVLIVVFCAAFWLAGKWWMGDDGP